MTRIWISSMQLKTNKAFLTLATLINCPKISALILSVCAVRISLTTQKVTWKVEIEVEIECRECLYPIS